MSEFTAYDGGEPFLRPENPFLLIMENESEEKVVYWYETEEDLIQDKTNWFEYRRNCGVEPVDQDAVFINKNGKRFSEDNIKSMFKNYSGGKLTPHMMRHEYITVITKETGDITFAQEQARHKSSTVTMNSYDSGASRSLSVLENL